MNKIINELNKEWDKESYLVINCKNNKGLVTNLRGLVTVAHKAGVNTKLVNTTSTQTIEHDLGNELEQVGIYKVHLKSGEKMNYEDIKLVHSLKDFFIIGD